ncbi:MAG: hypothetical protein WD231_05565 [Candidatus Woykebacteria bacterium]
MNSNTEAEVKFTYPGKNLAHRFRPTESIRQIIEPLIKRAHPFASQVNFHPVATLNLPDKNVYVRPIRNLQPRHISPLPLQGPFALPIRGERTFELSADLQDQIQKRVGVVMSPYEVDPKTRPVPPGLTPQPEPNPPIQVNKPQQSVPVSAPILSTQTQVAVAPPTQVTSFQTNHLPTTPSTPVATQAPLPRVLSPTSQVSQVPVVQIPQTITTPQAPRAQTIQTSQPPLAPVPVQKPIAFSPTNQALIDDVAKLKEELLKESITTNVTQERIGELSNKYQSQIVNLINQNNYLISEINNFKAKLTDESRKRQASENQLSVVTSQLKNEVEKLKIERDGLLGKLKTSETQFRNYHEAQEKNLPTKIELTQLNAKIAELEREKSESETKAIKLKSLVNELQEKGAQKHSQLKEMVMPTLSFGKSQYDAPVRVIQPTQAIGKMAPALTTIPNVVSGIIKDRNGLLLTDVVVVVKDASGNPVRALKSNKIGQFAISTPLPEGTYTMELEREENEFDVVQIKLGGKIVPPIEIRAR